MDRNAKRLIIAIIIGLIISMILHIVGGVRGHQLEFIRVIKTTGAILFFTIVIAIIIQITEEFIVEFLEARTKWRWILFLILLAQILKAITGYKLSQ